LQNIDQQMSRLTKQSTRINFTVLSILPQNCHFKNNIFEIETE